MRMYCSTSFSPSMMSATSLSRTGPCMPWPTTSCSRSSSSARLDSTLMLMLTPPDFRSPAGMLLRTMAMAPVTWERVIPAAESLAGSTSTFISLTSPPRVLTEPTPGCRASLGSISSSRSCRRAKSSRRGLEKPMNIMG